MACERYYKDYFNIDPKYYAAVTADLIREGKVDWKSFFLTKHLLNCWKKLTWS